MKHDLEAVRADACYHEAAHAIFDYHAGFTIRHVCVTEELDAMCVSAVPVEPDPWQAMDLVTGLFASEIAAFRRRGEQKPLRSFDEFASEVRDAEEEDPDGSLGLRDCDDVQAMKMLELAASRPDNPWGNLEECYHHACKTAAFNVDFWWPEIKAVGKRLLEVGVLDGEECAWLIESADYGEE